MEQELRDRWTSIAGSSRAADQAVAGLLSRYREPHRSYHGLAHVLRVLRTVDDLVPAVEVDDADAVRFAAWFHDAVYDPRASGNEAASAHLAIEVLAQLGQPADRAARTAELVEATAGHIPTNSDEAVLIDADLAVLGADPSTYEAYAAGSAGSTPTSATTRGVPAGPWSCRASSIGRRSSTPRRCARARHGLGPTSRPSWPASVRRAQAEVTGPSTARGTSTTVAAVATAPDTVTEAVQLLRQEGYSGEIEILGGTVCCSSCATAHPFDRLVADHVYRFEGASDPGDEAIVIGVTCPACGAKGVLVSAYGPDADPEEMDGIRMVAERYGER